jgi:hypothetical protein
MSKYFLVLAAFFLFGTQLTAGSIQNLEITSPHGVAGLSTQR